MTLLKQKWEWNPKIKEDALNRGLGAEIRLLAAMRELPRLLEAREEQHESYADYLAPADRSPQALLDAEMNLLAQIPSAEPSGKELSIAAKDRELRRLKATDPDYLRVKAECQDAALKLARLNNDIEVCRADIQGSKALLNWLTALIGEEGE